MQDPQAINAAVAETRPPAKLNLFLELLARRDDGYHEIDTVMVPIDWCDLLRIRRTSRSGIDLRVGWLPSPSVMARRLSRDSEPNHTSCQSLLEIPADDDNLVVGALQRFTDVFEIAGGFECELWKSIPAGAGMGGASSDAASALRCAATLCGLPLQRPELHEIACAIGSDVPFFLGRSCDRSVGSSITAARATGRGEKLTPIALMSPIDSVVVFPGVMLPTGRVYANSQVPTAPQNSYRLVELLSSDAQGRWKREMLNRLVAGAKKIAPQIDETLESMWRAGLRTCQLTGSGSACFAIASSPFESKRMAAQLQAMLEPGAIVMAARSTSVPASVELT